MNVSHAHVMTRLAVAAGLIAALTAFLWIQGRPSPAPDALGQPQCGHWSILRCCELLGAPIDVPTLMSMLPFEERGHSVLQLAEVLERIGLRVDGRRETIDTLAHQPTPCIAHMGKAKHFVVVDGVANGRVHLFDCWGRRTTRKVADFVDDWSGHVLLVSRPERDTLLPAFVSSAPQPAPRIQFDATFVDQGEIRPNGEAVSFVYHIRNCGNRDLEIMALHKQCTCIEAKYPDDPIPPGGEGLVELAFNTANREGPFFHQVLLESNDPLLPVAKLKATGYIDTGVTAHPALIDLGDVGLGEERAIACVVKYAGLREEFAIGGVDCNSAIITMRHFGVDTPEAAELFWRDAHGRVAPGARGHVVVVMLRPTPGQIGEVRAEVVIETNLEGFERVVVPVTGRVVRQKNVFLLGVLA